MKKRYTVKIALLTLIALVIMVPHALAFFNQAKLKVMSRNLYVGGDVFRVIEAATNTDEIPFAVADLLDVITLTDFEKRSEAIAEEIREKRPHLIGLQEVAIIYEQLPSDFLSGNPKPATDEIYNYLDMLMDRLKEEGLEDEYSVEVQVFNSDIELPAAVLDENGLPILKDVRLIDSDVILVRKDVDVLNTYAKNFKAKIPIPVGETTINVLRGYAAVDAKIENLIYHFVNTHLEVAGGIDDLFSAVQAAQMAELLIDLALQRKPIILAGDLNSDPEDFPFDSPSYGWIIPPYWQAKFTGYRDVWRFTRKPPELTCCFDEFVEDAEATLYERIDHVLIKPKKGLIPVRSVVESTGDEMQDMIDAPITNDPKRRLWPSDHAGVFAWIKFLDFYLLTK